MARLRRDEQRIAIGGAIHAAHWLCETRAGQSMLAGAYRAALRPRCQCVGGGVEMYVGLREAVYYLSRMPGTGILHDAACPSAEQANLYSGADSYASEVMVEDAGGGINVKFSESMTQSDGMPATALSMDGLLDLLIEEARLNIHETGAGPVGWRTVQPRLIAAASMIVVSNEGPLASQLLVPEAFDKSQYATQQAEHQAFLAQPGRRLICAPLREIRQSAYGWQIVLKHLPGSRLWVSKSLALRVRGRYGGTLQWEDASYPALCLAVVRPQTKASSYHVAALAVRRTDERFMPCLSGAQAQVAANLVEGGLNFVRPLRFDVPWTRALADFAVLDSASCPRPILVLSPTGCRELDDAKRQLAGILARGANAGVAVVDGASESGPSPATGSRTCLAILRRNCDGDEHREQRL
jgi:hypothetical protein